MIKRIVVLQSEDPVVAELMSGGERPSDPREPAFASLTVEQIVDEIGPGTTPSRCERSASKAALEAEREAIERVLTRPTGTASRPPASWT